MLNTYVLSMRMRVCVGGLCSLMLCFFAACLVKLLKLINLTGHSVARETVTN
jgi:hypothetical protein